MRMCRFAVQVTQPLVDDHIQRLFSAIGDACVEIGAWRGWAAVIFDRSAPTLADALVVAIRELEAAGMVPLDAGLDDNLVSTALIAERSGCSPHAVRRWASGEGGAGGFPEPVVDPAATGGIAYYRWSDVDPWLQRRLGLPMPGDDELVYRAVNLALRLRAIAERVDRMAAIRSLL